MNDLVDLFSEMKRDLQGMKKSLAKLLETPSKRLAEEWTRKDDCMKLLGISSRTFNRLTKSGKLPYSKINGIIYIKTTDIDHLLNTHYKA